MFKVWKHAFAVLLPLGLAGCQTASGPSSAATTAAISTVILPDPVIVAEPQPLLPEPGEPDVAVPAGMAWGASWPKEWVNAWVPLESWSKFNGLGKPSQLTSGVDAMYELLTSNGVIAVKMGNHAAHFAGLEYWLGFAPRLVKGLPYIHSLDARKTLQVLLNGSFQLPRTNRTIAIDPGHGGKDSGTQSSINLEYEKRYTLDWARRLQRLLVSNGWNVILTRTNDSDLSLVDRVALADRVNADIFLSLHFNSGGANRELSGVETYCVTPVGMPSNLRREFEDDPRQTHPNNAFDDQNFQLASLLHRSVLEATGAVDRGVRRARFMVVLRGQQRPAVLIEGGFLSNASEARRIANPAYRQMLAEAVARALE